MNSDSIFNTSWHYVWNNNRRELLRGLLGLLRDKPVFLFLTAACIARPSWWSFPVIVLALVFNQLIVEIFLKLEAFRTQRKILTGFLNIFEGPDITSRSATKYKVSEYLDWQYEDIDKNLLKRFTGLLGIAAFSIDDTVDLYHIEIEGANCPNLICYNIPPLKSYIFMNAAPQEKIQVFKKFCFLHELGHASLNFATTSAFSRHGNKMYLTLIVFLATVCPYHAMTNIFYWIIAALLLLSLIEKIIVNVTKKVNDECSADVMAIGYLDIEERKMLRQTLLKYPAKDPTLSDAQNNARHLILMNNLELMISDEDNDDLALDHVFSKIKKPSFGLLILTGALVSSLAFFSAKIGGLFTLGLFIACLACFILFCFCHLLIDACHSHITKRLSKWRPYQDSPQPFEARL